VTHIIDGNVRNGYVELAGLVGVQTGDLPGKSWSQHQQPNRVLHWLALALTPGIGSGRGRKPFEPLFSASLTDQQGAGLPAGAAQSMAPEKTLELAGEEPGRVRAEGATVITQDDGRSPQRAAEIYDPPLLLYIKDNPDVINSY